LQPLVTVKAMDARGAHSFAKVIVPEYTSILDLAFIPTGLSEVTTGLWLMGKGLNQKSPALKA
jgi:hypothetical protein